MSYLDTIVACPNGFNAIITEYHVKGFGRFLQYVDGVPIGFCSCINRFYPDTDMISPCLAYLRVNTEDMLYLAGFAWDNAIPLAISAGVYADIYADPDAFAMYRTSHDWIPFLDVDGNETAVDTGIVNPLYGPLKAIGAFA